MHYKIAFADAVNVIRILHTALTVVDTERKFVSDLIVEVSGGGVSTAIAVMDLVLLLVVIAHWMDSKQLVTHTQYKYASLFSLNATSTLLYVGAYSVPGASCSYATNSGVGYALTVIVAGIFGPFSAFFQWVFCSLWSVLLCSGSRAIPLVLSVSDVFHTYSLNSGFLLLFLWYASHIKGKADARKTRLAQTASRYKSEFISRMTHELKTPLAVLTSATEYLVDNGPPNHWHDVQCESISILRSLLDNVLVLHRIETGQQSLTVGKFSMIDVANESRKALAVSASLKKLAFSVAIDQTLALSPVYVGDRVRVRQIILNLGSNAIRFTDSGFVRVYIGVVRSAEEVVDGDGRGDGDRGKSGSGSGSGSGNDSVIGDRLMIRVEDSGAGMSEKQQAQVLDSSIEALPVIPERGGSGLGLRIVNKMVEMMHGRLWIECEGMGLGTTVCAEVVLPRQKKHTRRQPHPQPQLQSQSQPRSPPCTRSRVRNRNRNHSRPASEAGAETEAETLSQHCGNEHGYENEVEVEVEVEVEAETEKGVGNGNGYTSRHVLLVEDNQSLRTLFGLALDAAGHTYIMAGDGREGVDMWMESVSVDVGGNGGNTRPFDLVCMDIRMPVMSGLDATKAIRAIERERGLGRIPIIALTAHSMIDELNKCLEAGFTGYLPKPVGTAMLLDAVDSLGQSDSVDLRSHLANARNA